MKKLTSLRFIISIFTVIILSATIIFFISSSKKLFLRHSEISLKNIAQDKAATIQSEINYAEGSIQLLSNFISSQMNERELKKPNAILSKYSRQLPFDFIEYIRWDGLNFMNSVAGEKPFDASERVYYKEGIKGNTGIWPNFKPKVAKEVLLNFYTPIYYKGEISGVITGAIGEKTSFRSKLSSSFFGYPIVTFVCDKDFVVVSSNSKEVEPGLNLKDWTSDKLIADLIEHCESKNTEPFKYEINNSYGLCCTSPVPITDWNVIAIVFPTILSAVEKETTGNVIEISIIIISILISYLIISLFLQAKANKIIHSGLIHSANYDELTGLLNRHAYENDLAQINMMELKDTFNYVVFDVNGLKNANDNFGHHAGDELIQAAAGCIKDCFEKYGKVYRTGGDEFIAMIDAQEEEISLIKYNFSKQTSAWRGIYTSSLKIPAGFVSKKEMPKSSIHEIMRLADQRMYKEKSLIYISSGVDRRAQSAAYEVLCTSYTKILKINLTTDSFSIIQMESTERHENKGYHEKISQWLLNFGNSGQVHSDDLDNYFAKTSLGFMKTHFMSGEKELCISYRRLIGDKFHKVLMEIIPAKDYSDTNQSLFLYVKNIDKD